MDSTGKIYLAIAAIVIVGSLTVLWYLSKKTPKGVVLGISVVLYVLAVTINPGNVRELYVLKGTLQVIGSLGSLLGIIDLFGKKKNQAQN